MWSKGTEKERGQEPTRAGHWITDFKSCGMWITSLMKGLVSQLFLTLCNPMDCSPLGSSVYWTQQARILEWAAIPFSRGSSPLRNRTRVSCMGRQILYTWATWEAYDSYTMLYIVIPNSMHSDFIVDRCWNLTFPVSSFWFFIHGSWNLLQSVEVQILLSTRIIYTVLLKKGNTRQSFSR